MKIAYLILIIIALTGCKKNIDCSIPNGEGLVGEVFADKIIKKLREENDEMENKLFDKQEIRALVAKVKFYLIDVRTSQNDPDSRKVFCSAKLKIVIPTEVQIKANKAFELAGQGKSIAKIADNIDLDRQEDSYVKETIDYNYIPTDNDTKILAQVDEPETVVEFMAGVLAANLLYSSMEAQKSKEDRKKQEELVAIEQQKKAANELALIEAKGQNEIAKNYLNEVWTAIPTATRETLSKIQIAWNKKKQLDCKINSLAEGKDELEIEILKLRCDSQKMQERAGELRTYIQN